MASIIDKLKGVDPAKLTAAQLNKIAAALAQEAKQGARASSDAKAVLKSIAAAEAALKGSEKDFSSIED